MFSAWLCVCVGVCSLPRKRNRTDRNVGAGLYNGSGMGANRPVWLM